MGDSIRFAWKEIIRRKSRTTGAILSYFMVGAIVIIVASLATITHNKTQSVLWDMGSHSVAYIPRITTEGCCIQKYATDNYDPDREGFIVNNAPSNIIPAELIKKIQESPNVLDASPYLLFRIRASLGSGEWLLGGIDLTRPKSYPATVVAQSQVLEGRFLTPDDKNMVMLEKEFASVHKLGAGGEIQLGDQMYKIAAVVKPPLRPGKANIYLSLPDLRELVDSRLQEQTGSELANAVLIESKGAKYHKQALEDVNNILGQTSRITSFGCSRPGSLAMGISEKTALIITAIVVLSMFLLAMKIQFSSVVQRRFDIGVLKAIGWQNKNIISQIISESLFYALTGGILGVITAYIIVFSLPSEIISGKNGGFNITILLTGLLLPLIGGLLSGIIASIRAVRMQTANILRLI